MQIDGSTKLCGVLGAPITHTASPAMHNAAFAALSLNWSYLAFHVEPQNLQAALAGARDLGLVGVNLTVPHKILALDIVDEVDANARRVGAVNTIAFERGRMRGFNTDGYGFTTAIREEFGLTLSGKRVLILGAGGAGRAIAVQCELEGAGKVYVANRTVSKLKDIPCVPLELHEGAIQPVASELDLIVNATAVGLNAGESLGLSARVFSPRVCVFDTIYRPAKTELLRVAETVGARVANGLSMLLHQGAQAFEIWTGQTAPIAIMRDALRKAIYG